MRRRNRRVCLAFALALILSPTALGARPGEDLTAAAAPAKNWAAPQIASVVLAGVMGPDVASFRPDDR